MNIATIVICALGQVFFTSKFIIVIVFPCTCSLIFALLIRPFKTPLKNIPYCINSLTISLVVALRVYIQFLTSSSPENLSTPWTLFLIQNIIVLPLSQIINLIISVYLLYKSICTPICQCHKRKKHCQKCENAQKEKEK